MVPKHDKVRPSPYIQGEIRDRAVFPAEIGDDGFPVFKVQDADDDKVIRGSAGVGVRLKTDMEGLRQRVIKPEFRDPYKRRMVAVFTEKAVVPIGGFAPDQNIMFNTGPAACGRKITGENIGKAPGQPHYKLNRILSRKSGS
jgi:hypothetical protein